MTDDEFLEQFSYETRIGMTISLLHTGITEHEWKNRIVKLLTYKISVKSDRHLVKDFTINNILQECDRWCLANCNDYWCSHRLLQKDYDGYHQRHEWFYYFKSRDDALKFKLWKPNEVL